MAHKSTAWGAISLVGEDKNQRRNTQGHLPQNHRDGLAAGNWVGRSYEETSYTLYSCSATENHKKDQEIAFVVKKNCSRGKRLTREGGKTGVGGPGPQSTDTGCQCPGVCRTGKKYPVTHVKGGDQHGCSSGNRGGRWGSDLNPRKRGETN